MSNSRTELTSVLLGGNYRSGKGTLARTYQSLGIPVFETGEVLRSIAEQEPTNPALDAFRKGEPVESGLVTNIAKRWLLNLIVSRKKRNLVFFDGIPRLLDQMTIVEFLRERGYVIKVVWFTTPESVCENRPTRPGRKEDTDPIIMASRRKFYREGTLPVLHHFKKTGMCRSRGDLLEIDNTLLQPTETHEVVRKFIFG